MPTDAAAFEAHDSIFIEGDEQFVLANGVTGGSGTEADPYVIEALEISGPERYALYLKDTTKHVVIRDVNITNTTGADIGIQLENTANVVVENITLERIVMNLYIIQSSQVDITHVTAIGGKFDIHMTDNLTIEGYHRTAGNTSEIYHGVWINRASDMVFNNSSVEDIGTVGIYMDSCSDFTISNTSVTNVTTMAMDVRNGWANRGNFLYDVTVFNCGRGIVVKETDDLAIIGANLEVSDFYNINVTGSDRLVLKGNRLISKGLFLDGNPCDPDTGFYDNTIDGIPIHYSSGDIDMVIEGNISQVFLLNSTGCTLRDMELLAPSFIRWSNYTTIENCIVSDTILGFMVEECDDSRIEGSTITNCSAGLLVHDSDRLLLEGNRFIRCRLGVEFRSDKHRYYKNENQTVLDNTFDEGSIGIVLLKVDNTNITGNVFTNIVQAGIRVRDCYYVLIESNVMSDNGQLDIDIWDVQYLNISSNEFNGSTSSIRTDRFGLSAIYNNTFSNTNNSILIRGSGNHITWNTISNTRYYGLSIYGRLNIVHHNNFTGNGWDIYYIPGGQVLDESTNSTQWDDGEEGNYWDDYEEKYPNATRNGNIWSEPYQIPTDAKYELYDRYPLVEWEGSSADPVVRCDAGEDVTVDEGAEVQFNGSFEHYDPENLTYTWVFTVGDINVTLQGKSPTYTFTVPGFYPVWLSVEDEWYYRVHGRMNVTVLDAKPPHVDAGEDITAEIFSEVTFDGSGSHDTGSITDYFWTIELEDETITLTGRTVDFLCIILGDFTVTLTVWDKADHYSEDTLVLTVVDTVSPRADAGDDREILQFGTVELDASASTDNVGIVEYEWSIDLGDETITLEGKVVTYKFEEAGMYKASLRVRDDSGNEDAVQITINVKDIVAPSGDLGGNKDVNTEGSLTLDASDWTDNVDIVRYTWTIIGPDGEKVVLNGQFATHYFASAGNHNVTLVVVDAEGNEASDFFVVLVTEPEPHVEGDGTGWTSVIVLLVLAFVMFSVLVFVFMRRKG